MSLREKINRNPAIGFGVAAVGIVIAAWVLISTLTDKGLTAPEPDSYYFTTDDGQTLFSAPKSTIPPFEKDGKEAVRARVFTCDDGNTQFVAFLEKYSSEFARRAEQELAKPREPGAPTILDSPAAAANLMIKKPGGQWMPSQSAEAMNIMSVSCPSKDPWDLVELYP